jgi:hypothetical protein
MPSTYTLISSITAGSGGAANITFSSIPSTYTDLSLKFSLRSGTTGSAADNILVSLNSSTSSFSFRLLYATGSSVGSYLASDNTNIMAINGGLATSNTFGNGEIYIPNYTNSTNKSISSDSATETNDTTAYVYLYSGLWSNTSAINSIVLTANSATNFAQYSTAYLYGISNA